MLRKIPIKGPIVRGLDVSHYDGPIDFKTVKLSGREFAFAKCTEYNVDNTYARNKVQAQNAGMLFGAYHFFHPSRDPKAQAENFLSRAQLGKGNLVPVLDWESSDDIPNATDRARASEWLQIVEKAVGRPPIIYGSPYFLHTLNLGTSFSRYPLWVAHYGTTVPLVPDPWTNWAFWQHSEKGAVPGIPAPDEDLDIFNGTYADLQRFVL